MTIQQHEKTIEKAFGYEIERDIDGTLWLLRTDPTGRIVYHRVRLFEEGESCSINDLIRALCELKKWVDNVQERNTLAMRLILSCESVLSDIRRALKDKAFL